MSWIGLAGGARDLARTFVADRTEGQAQAHAARLAAIEELGAEFARPRRGRFDDLVDGLNRLPRPVMALGTIAFMGYAMADPVSFGARMEGLALVPAELWWLLGAVVSFYFGGRELHHFRDHRSGADPARVARVVENIERIRSLDAAPEPEGSPAGVPAPENAALADWRRRTAG